MEMNAKLLRCSRAFYCMFSLCDRFVLSVNSALHLQYHANVFCHISENKVKQFFFYLTKEFIILHRGGHWSGLLKCVCGMAMLQEGRERSDVLTRIRLTSKLMNKLSVYIFTFSWHTPNLHPLEWKKFGGNNKHRNSNIFIESLNTSSTFDSSFTLFAPLLLSVFSLDRCHYQMTS